MSAAHDLQRFLDAQAATYATALAEIRAGRKRSHWMWFIFPQIQGLGHSETAQRYAIASRDEASAYLAHPLLGLRLREITARARVAPLPARSPDRSLAQTPGRRVRAHGHGRPDRRAG